MKQQLGNTAPVIYPLSVYVIGTFDADGKANAMNAAWGIQCDYKKVVIYLAPHKTTENMQLHKAFTVSFATRSQVVPADYVGIVSGGKVEDKMERTGWHVEKASKVDAPLFKELPLTLECVVESFNQVGPDDITVVGRIVEVDADPSILTDGKIDTDKLQPIVYDSSNHVYRTLGPVVGHAFKDGLQLKE